MSLRGRLKFGLKTKILSILLGLALISLITSAYIAFRGMQKLKNSALEGHEQLGEKAINESKKALIDEAEQNLRRSTEDQAAISNAIFDKLKDETAVMGQFASMLWSNPSSFKARPSYSKEKEPKDIHSASVYMLAPGVSPDAEKVKRDLDLSSNMDEVFIPILGNNPELLSAVFIATPSGINRRYPWCSTYKPTYDPRERPWYKRAVETRKIGWSDVYVDASGLGLMVTCFQPVYDSLDELLCVVGADVTLKTIREEIINSPTDGYAFLMDSKGNVIVHEELSREGREWDESFGFIETLKGKTGRNSLLSLVPFGRSKKILPNLLKDNDPKVRDTARKMIEGEPGFTKATFDRLLFRVGVETESDLNNGTISVDLRRGFENRKISLPDDASVSKETDKWLITAGNKKYTVKKQEDKLNIFDEIEERITYAPIDSTNWHMGIVMPIRKMIAPALETEEEIADATEGQAEKINSQIGRAQRILFADFILIILVVSLIASRLARRITRPILELDRGAKIIGSGDLEHKLEVETGDEIEELANTFNKMTDDLKLYIKNLQETTAAKEKIESELKVATEIQASMLPRIFPPFPDRKEFSIYATMDPAKQVGGDFYDFFIIGDKKLCFLIGDVSGKGVPAALFMAISKTLLKTEGLRGHSPDEMLCRVNNMLCPDNDASMFVTLFCVILDLETGEVEYADGGHNPPLICSGGGCFEFMDVFKSFVVGPMPDTEYQSAKSTLNPGDIMFLYTDGVTEAMNPEQQQFSEERLKEYLSSLSVNAPKDIINAVRAEIEAFARGAAQSDDITMLALKFNGQQ